jgi:hypothetical protein
LEPRWAIEGAGGLGAPPATRLLADGLAVLDVPVKLAVRVRAFSTGCGRKTDEADAVSVGVAAWTATSLVSVRFDGLVMALRALTEHRDDLVKTRTQTVNRLRVLLAHLLVGGADVGLTADDAAGLLGRVRPSTNSRAAGRTCSTAAAPAMDAGRWPRDREGCRHERGRHGGVAESGWRRAADQQNQAAQG